MKDNILTYYNKQNINIRIWICKDINENNEKALCYVNYSINNLLNVKGIPELLYDIAQIEASDINGERSYYNTLTEFHGIFFVHHGLKLEIIEVESNKNRILSPYRKNNSKSCDIKATDSFRDYYFEIKDASSQITTQEIKNGIKYFKPMFEDDVYKWVLEKCKEAEQKGANYLLCRVPVWNYRADDKDFFYKWISKKFRITGRLSDNEVRITLPFQISKSFEGIYIIKPYGYMKLIF